MEPSNATPQICVDTAGSPSQSLKKIDQVLPSTGFRRVVKHVGARLGRTADAALGGFLSIDSTRAVIILIVVATLIRIAIAGTVGLGTDESYTVGNARSFSWSFVEYPPLHVWLVGAWAWLWQSENPLVVRLPFIALFAGSTWVMFRLTALLFNARAGFWASLLLTIVPVFTIPCVPISIATALERRLH
jgi:hypothetical protein